eukprot:TRINITY_DN59359_c0_g1_i1.p1 TRINITY_DN59359_c0_g1~~TRINITY_DN59359_c0_g1_i1.p1  ORF type:complete len:301 (-),score=25.01 TRINITY_DN59359_c0_g1_i1:71-973(-)
MSAQLDPAYSAVCSAFESFLDELTHIQDIAQRQFEDCKKLQAANQGKIQQCQKACSSKVITLDIGGTVFKTTEATLLSQPDTFFSAMLSSGEWNPDPATGSYFIDRSPTVFHAILQYLRTGHEPACNDWTEQDHRQLQSDLDFYSIPIKRPGAHWEPNIVFSDMNRTALIPAIDSNYSMTLNIITPPQEGEPSLYWWKLTSVGQICDGKVMFGGQDTISFEFDGPEWKLCFHDEEIVGEWRKGVPRSLEVEFNADSDIVIVHVLGKQHEIPLGLCWYPKEYPATLEMGHDPNEEQVFKLE